MVGAGIKVMYEGEAKARQVAGARAAGSDQVRANLPEGVQRPREKAAAAVNVSPRAHPPS
jgi:hypothetical protein